MQQHVESSGNCRLITNNMYIILFNYICEKATINYSDPIFEKKDLSDLAQESVTALITDLCQVFEPSNVAGLAFPAQNGVLI